MRKGIAILAVAFATLGFGNARFTPPIVGYVQNLPAQQLSPQEKNSLLHMREEEKLARDVYLTLYKKWRIPVFRNIAKSEAWHMQMIKLLLDKYHLPDPVLRTGNRIGYFTNPKLQSLYNQLVAQGGKSLIDALKVGATIEDLDIKDLQDGEKETDNRDIQLVYRNLEKGSRNHMRAFVGWLRRYRVSYTPKYISPAYYRRIISTPWERGPIVK
jgi:hypothetical protein